MDYVESAITAFNEELQLNLEDLNSIRSIWDAHEQFNLSQDSFTKYFFNQSYLMDLITTVKYRLTDIPFVNRSSALKYREDDKASILGKATFYLLRVYVTVTAMFLMYAAKISKTYLAIKIQVQPDFDIIKNLNEDVYPSILISFKKGQILADVACQAVFSSADIGDVINDESFIEKLKQLDIKLDMGIIYNNGPYKDPFNEENVSITELGTWFKSHVTPALKD